MNKNLNLFNAVKELSIVEVLKPYLSNVNLKGSNYLAICPFHQDTKPSLSINENKKCFKCFVCGVAGDAVAFVAKVENITKTNAAIKIAKTFNLNCEIDYAVIEKQKEQTKQFDLNRRYLDLARNFLQSEKSKNNQELVNFLNKRNLDQAKIDYFEIGYNPEEKIISKILTNENGEYVNIPTDCLFTRKELIDNDLIKVNINGEVFETFKNRLVFSIKDRFGNVVGFSGRDINTKSDIKYLNSKFNKTQTLFNIDKIAKNKFKTVFVVEGFMDAIALHSIGIENVVASMGVEISKEQVSLLKSIGVKCVILAFDFDNAGQTAQLNQTNLFESTLNTFVVDHKNFKVDMTNGFKDWDELVNFNNWSFEEAIRELGISKDQWIQDIKNLLNSHKHISIMLLNSLSSKYSTSEADKTLHLDECIEIINKYGVPIQSLNYVNYLKQFNLSDDHIYNLLDEAFIK